MFERLDHLEALATKRIVVGQTITMVLMNTTTLPIESFAPGRHKVEASSFREKLTRRQRRRRNIKARA